MRDDARRERLSEAAVTRSAAASEGAALSVAAGSMMFGALLSSSGEPAHAAAGDSNEHRPTDHNPALRDLPRGSSEAGVSPYVGPPGPMVEPPQDSASPAGSRAAVSAGGMDAAANGVAGTFDAASVSLQDEGDVFSGNNGVAADGGDAEQGGETNAIPAPAASDMDMHDLDLRDLDMRDLDLATPRSLGDVTGNISLPDLVSMAGRTVDMIADAAFAPLDGMGQVAVGLGNMEQRLSEIVHGIGTALPGPSAIGATLSDSLSAVGGGAISGVSMLDSLPASLLGAHAEPSAEGVLADAFGNFALPARAAHAPNDSFSQGYEDHASVMDSGLGLAPVELIGQSYADGMNMHDFGQDSMGSPLHGLV